jgi:hypothetical protein
MRATKNINRTQKLSGLWYRDPVIYHQRLRCQCPAALRPIASASVTNPTHKQHMTETYPLWVSFRLQGIYTHAYLLRLASRSYQHSVDHANYDFWRKRPWLTPSTIKRQGANTNVSRPGLEPSTSSSVIYTFEDECEASCVGINWSTAWNSGILENLTVAQLLNKFSSLRHCFLPWPQASAPYHLNLFFQVHFNIISPFTDRQSDWFRFLQLFDENCIH